MLELKQEKSKQNRYTQKIICRGYHDGDQIGDAIGNRNYTIENQEER